jgi:hypothetical protein
METEPRISIADLKKVGVTLISESSVMLKCQKCGRQWSWPNMGGEKPVGHWQCANGCNSDRMGKITRIPGKGGHKRSDGPSDETLDQGYNERRARIGELFVTTSARPIAPYFLAKLNSRRSWACRCRPWKVGALMVVDRRSSSCRAAWFGIAWLSLRNGSPRAKSRSQTRDFEHSRACQIFQRV